MRDEEVRELELPLQLGEQVDHGRLDGGVEGGDRLVEELDDPCEVVAQHLVDKRATPPTHDLRHYEQSLHCQVRGLPSQELSDLTRNMPGAPERIKGLERTRRALEQPGLSVWFSL